MKRAIIIFPMLLAVIQGFAQFKADMEMSMAGENLVYTVYSDTEKYRYEFVQDGQQVALIIKPQTDKSFMLIPDQKIFMPMTNENMMGQGNDPAGNYAQLKKDCTEKIIGQETVEGYLCEKRELYKNDEKIMTVWYSSELDFPVKLTDHKEGLSMTLKNIESWSPSPGMFQVPADYTNITGY